MNADSLSGHIRHTRRVLLTTLQRFVEDGCFNHAAGLTYTTLFAIVPLLTVTYSMLSSFPFFHGMGEQLQDFIFSNFVPSAGETISQWLTSFSTQARSLTMVGMAFLLGTALMMLRTIDHAINRIFHTQDERRAITSFLLYWAILSLGPLLIGLGFAATSYLITVKFIHEATTMLGVKGVILRMMPVFLSSLAFTLLYLTVPNRRVLFRYASVGGLTTALLFELAKSGFGWLLTLSPTYEFIYGAFAAVPVFLLWIYLSWLLVLLGAELVHSLGEPRSLERGEFSPNLAMVAILSVFHNQFAKGEATMLEQVQGAGWPIGQKHWEQVTSWLTEQGVLGRNHQGALAPAHSFQTLSLASVMADSPWPQPSSKELNSINLSDYPEWFEIVVNSLREVNQSRDKALAGTLDTVFTQTQEAQTV